MPCEGCACSFTVFRRKRSCSDCKRFYCNSCLSASRRNLLCERCAIFARRPLLRIDLQQLKPKDLIFYLQSKHISTAGCVEKDELVGLILTHIQQAETSSPGSSIGSGSSRSGAEPVNSFDSLKQTCQNFFSNITDNISDSFASFDGKNPATKSQQNNYNQNSNSQRSGRTSNGSTHIFDQPRVNTRELPTYASFQNYNRSQQYAASSVSPTLIEDRSIPRTQMPPSTCDESISPDASNAKSNSHSSSTTSPVISSNSSLSVSQPPEINERYLAAITRHEGKSDCECSDDEIFTAFSERVLTRKAHCPQEGLGTNQQRAHSRQGLDTEFAGASLSSINAAQSCQNASSSSKEALGEDEAEESSHSSFEELGAIGGISDESKVATDTNSGNTEQWQLLDAQRAPAEVEDGAVAENEISVDTNMLQMVAVAIDAVLPRPPIVPQRTRKVTRRRSDTYLNRRRPISDDESPTSSNNAQYGVAGALTLVREHAEEDVGDVVGEGEVVNEISRQFVNCKRCGKNKSNIRRYVEKMRRHLESSQMSEADIKRELGEFLAYLEKRTMSMDCSDTETAASSLSGAVNCAQIEFTVSESPLSPPSAFDDNAGIHVYAATSEYSATHDFSRFINLEDYESLKELECLSVKQLKEVLMLNRVDYKGCCEKQELLDRVERLWKNLKSTPGIDKLQTDELCKICMDAPIECIILECGHMATCTNCGKVLSECPICRQYIVRVVRFFRA